MAAVLCGTAHVQYVRCVTGERQLLVLTAVPDESALYEGVPVAEAWRMLAPWMGDWDGRYAQ
ncbi:hypothetical protein AB0D34_25380 [Streptomyces sp. NPDC048420]|uniref:hypothetical protein n=1 Tax=Streptomyces sp. NPDC048420 TaxID=3155755 RepID=UPI00343155EE